MPSLHELPTTKHLVISAAPDEDDSHYPLWARLRVTPGLIDRIERGHRLIESGQHNAEAFHYPVEWHDPTGSTIKSSQICLSQWGIKIRHATDAAVEITYDQLHQVISQDAKTVYFGPDESTLRLWAPPKDDPVVHAKKLVVAAAPAEATHEYPNWAAIDLTVELVAEVERLVQLADEQHIGFCGFHRPVEWDGQPGPDPIGSAFMADREGVIVCLGSDSTVKIPINEFRALASQPSSVAYYGPDVETLKRIAPFDPPVESVAKTGPRRLAITAIPAYHGDEYPQYAVVDLTPALISAVEHAAMVVSEDGLDYAGFDHPVKWDSENGEQLYVCMALFSNLGLQFHSGNDRTQTLPLTTFRELLARDEELVFFGSTEPEMRELLITNRNGGGQ